MARDNVSKSTTATSQPRDAVEDFLRKQDPSSATTAPVPVAPIQPAQANGHHPPNPTDGQEGDEEDEEVELDDAELEALLRQLEEADGVATGLEDKIDHILESLEGLIVGLESASNHSQIRNDSGKTDG